MDLVEGDEIPQGLAEDLLERSESAVNSNDKKDPSPAASNKGPGMRALIAIR